jgi:dolichol-phosphate mannosyltransferase
VRLAVLATLAVRYAGAARRRPALGAVPADDADGGAISVVIPARDEETGIAACVEAARAARGVAEVIVVDDESTDATAPVAARAGARVVRGAARPAGWAGKTWALAQGAAAAGHDRIVACDADVRLAPAVPARLTARAVAHGADLASVTGVLDEPRAGGRWLHAAMLASLVARLGVPDAARPARPRRTLANGQCLAWSRARLDELGGWESVRGEVVEDVALARHVAARGGRVETYDGAGAMRVRGYGGTRATWRGWGRSIGLPGAATRAVRTGDAALVAVAHVAPLAALVLGTADAIDAALLAMRLGLLVGTRRAYAQRGPAYWCSPLADPLVVAVLVADLMRRRHRWRGREYPTTPRRSAGRSPS